MANPYSELLKQGASEARQYVRASTIDQPDQEKWLNACADRMDGARHMTLTQVEDAIAGIAYSIVDIGLLSSSFAPSLHMVLDAPQWQRKREARK